MVQIVLVVYVARRMPQDSLHRRFATCCWQFAIFRANNLAATDSEVPALLAAHDLHSAAGNCHMTFEKKAAIYGRNFSQGPDATYPLAFDKPR